MFYFIYFDMLIFFGLFLRVMIVAIGILLSVKIIGLKHIIFLKQYVKKSFFDFFKLFSWLIALFSIVYFEYLIKNANSIPLKEVYSKNFLLATFVILLLLGVILYALVETIHFIDKAQKIKERLDMTQHIKKGTKIAGVASFFIPGGILAKVGFFSVSKGVDAYINSRINSELSDGIAKTVKGMLVVTSINLSIILISTYLILGQIVFW